jgi:nitrate/nitrite-specific signal transduction histidine kinase
VSKQNNFPRKHFFIDQKFQGRYMVTFLIPMLVLLVFMIFTLYLSSQAIINTTVRIIKYDVESKISLQLQDQQQPTIERYESLLDSIQKYLRTFSNNRDFRKNLMSSLLWVFGIGVFLVVIQIVLLTIFFSHKVAGPVYRFEKVCNNIINGIYTDEIRLRQGDEMQNLARLFNEALKCTRERLQIKESDNQLQDK